MLLWLPPAVCVVKNFEAGWQASCGGGGAIVVVFVVAGKIVVLVLVLVRWCKILNTEEDIYVSDVSIVVFCCCW